ncbi:hypothetical protein M901_0634 [Bacteriovorax sp. DB6_IX]|nr:hypothetical protein M901_0634 [Bacteriovorax sp. DB6_IX]
MTITKHSLSKIKVAQDYNFVLVNIKVKALVLRASTLREIFNHLSAKNLI